MSGQTRPGYSRLSRPVRYWPLLSDPLSLQYQLWGWGSHEGLSGFHEKLRGDAAEAALIRDLATDLTKREMFDRLHEHLNRLADEVEQAMKSGATK